MYCGIYLIEHTASGKVYVGSATVFRKRWNTHKYFLRSGTHHSAHLQAAWNKYGEESFVFKSLFVCAKDLLIFYEQRAIDVYQSANRRFGFNMREKAESMLGYVPSAVTREKLRAANLGKKYSAETCAKLSAMRRGRKMPDGFGEKIRLLKTGSTHTDEAKAKLSAAHTGRKHSVEHIESRSKLTYDEADEIRKIHAEGGVTQASIAARFNIDPSTVSNIVHGKRWARQTLNIGV